MAFGRKKRDENGWIIENPNHKDTVGKTENFLSRNVKLITFLICLGVFLAFFGPLTIFKIIAYIEERKDTRPVMSEEELITLSELDRDLYYSDIKGFKGTEDIRSITVSVIGGGTATREVEIYYYFDVGENYTALAIAEIDTEKIIYFQISNVKNQWRADVLKDDIRSFLAGNPVPTTAPEETTSTPTTEQTKEP
ncbi:MAG: hypothetical protein E7629_00320 [Ruminococcaceae bacterium]|nr:hypothetical protein [Oscillospiraceae bacterium]